MKDFLYYLIRYSKIFSRENLYKFLDDSIKKYTLMFIQDYLYK
ncbi:hypothetical protein Metig_0244 [Methanotorris igneus Kol 5]|uniref:Uncharacterized protein n=1 Tax=Methanotorris igneus (strain DSM 5666 / JCM 11834 / Kol 5) TaxID=880724 RepID=F6BAB1_METIK|nr:hypothetical protein Metig_0244 [Methanotorris igneus Kol 5]